MFNQYYAQRFRSMYPPIVKKIGHRTVYYTDPRDRQIGMIPIGILSSCSRFIAQILQHLL